MANGSQPRHGSSDGAIPGDGDASGGWSVAIERDCVRRAAAGEAEAAGRLYDAYIARLYRYCLARVGDETDAEDLAEEIFLKVLRAIDRFEWRPFSTETAAGEADEAAMEAGAMEAPADADASEHSGAESGGDAGETSSANGAAKRHNASSGDSPGERAGSAGQASGDASRGTQSDGAPFGATNHGSASGASHSRSAFGVAHQRSPFGAWLFRIAHNHVVSFHRRQALHRRNVISPRSSRPASAGSEEEDGGRDGANGTPEWIRDGARGPQELTETRLAVEEVFAAVRELPQAQREVIELRFGAGLSVAETAEALGKHEPNVKVLQHKGIKKLKALLREAEDTPRATDPAEPRER